MPQSQGGSSKETEVGNISISTQDIGSDFVRDSIESIYHAEKLDLRGKSTPAKLY